jgi:serine/threonine protein kinase
MNIMFENTE